MLREDPVGVLQTIATRLEDVAEAWGNLWRGGEEYTAKTGEALKPITGEELRRVLVRQGTGKAKGAGGWRPKELAALAHDLARRPSGGLSDSGRPSVGGRTPAGMRSAR